MPYFEIVGSEAEYLQVTTLSTVVMAFVAALLLVRPAIEGGWDRQAVIGRGLGSFRDLLVPKEALQR